MKSWRHKLPQHKALYLLLLGAIVFALLSQHHFHIHHADTHVHEHGIQHHDNHGHRGDVHAAFDTSHPVDHTQVQIIDLKLEGWLKYFNDDLQQLPLAILFVLLLLVPLILSNGHILNVISQLRRIQYNYQLPASRAPPALH